MLVSCGEISMRLASALELALAIIGTAVTVASLVYALKTQRDKERLERLVRAKLKGIGPAPFAVHP
jgi:hypothetical protein